VSDRILRGALSAALLVGTLAACSEQVTGSLGCPALCSDESTALRDTVLVGAVVLDSGFTGFPRLGESRDVSVQSRSDTADIRLVTRFDTLPKTFVPVTAQPDSLIRRVDSATMIFAVDTLASKATTSFTVDAYDVDTTAADTVTAALLPLFRPGRLIGSQTYQPADVKDTMSLTLDNASLLGKIRDSLRLRIGLRVRGNSPQVLRVLGSSFAPRVRFRVSADTAVKPDTVFLNSSSPVDQSTIQASLQMYPVIAAGALPPAPAGRLTIGGIAGARTYLSFAIPPIVLDSVQVIRASLLLTQIQGRSTGNVADSSAFYTQPILASPGTPTIFTQITSFLGSPTAYGVDSMKLTPRDSGFRSLEIVNLVRIWRGVGLNNSTRAIVLRSPLEGNAPAELSFVSMEGPVALRPRLRLTYVPRRGFGIP
jgi:hypothetical protein